MTTKTSAKTPTAALRDRLTDLDPTNTSWGIYLDQALTEHTSGEPGRTQLDLLWCLDNDPDGLDQHRHAARLAGALNAWTTTNKRLEQRHRELVRILDHAPDNTDDPAAAALAALNTHLPELATIAGQLEALKTTRPWRGGYDPARTYQPLTHGIATRALRIGAWAEPLLLHRFHAFEAGLEPDPLPTHWTIHQLVTAWRNSHRHNAYLDTALNPYKGTLNTR